MTPSTTTPRTAREADDEDDQMELFMRHSSPIDRPSSNQPSPMTVRNSSPASMDLSRPRSNPRNRTPMRFESPLGSNAFQIPEGEEGTVPNTNEGRRITILPMAGSARGTNIANFRNRDEAMRAVNGGKSQKQGPSHQKVRRWGNENFVNLAKEVGSKSASEALLRGHAHASEYRSVYPHEKSENSVMSKLIRCEDDKQLQTIRDKFFEGELYGKPQSTTGNKQTTKGPLTREQRMNRIDNRVRHVVVQSIENSYPATMVLEAFESFLLHAYNQDTIHRETETESDVWKDILVDPPTISKQGDDTSFLVIRFLFDRESSTGGFHRLLLHALVQFHGLTATSSTTSNGRLLTATGSLADSDHKLVDCITQKKEKNLHSQSTDGQLEIETNRLKAMKV